MEQIRWSNRFKGDTGNRCLVTVDGTDFRIGEPVPFRRVWYSQKYSGPALRYEVAVCIATGDIVAFNGPFAPKTNPDITIFRYGLKRQLGPAEKVVCDKGYKGDTRTCTPYNSLNKHHRKAMSVARARHETVNRRLKVWKVLRNGFRHHRNKHNLVFRAVISLTQIYFNEGHRPFQLKAFTYSDPLWMSWTNIPETAEQDPPHKSVTFARQVQVRTYNGDNI
jgi:DDE superfamily endonuclease